MRSNTSSPKSLPKPSWLKVKAPGSPEYLATKAIIKSLCLHTVCEEAKCPNAGECWANRTATFLIMGDTCTRHCRFCGVKKLAPEINHTKLLIEPEEPQKVAEAIKKLGLKHAVITSVTRDDLPDGGATHYAKVVEAIHKNTPECRIELLIPDLKGDKESIATILNAKINILNHNLETVRSLYATIRPEAIYERSLFILKTAKELEPSVITKSGIMVGLGETREEVFSLLDDLFHANVDIVTIGQYLRPTQEQIPIHSYITPGEFQEYETYAKKVGFKFVESGPLVRSSYHAWAQI